MPDAGAIDQHIAAWQGGRLVPCDKLAVHRLGLKHPAVSVFLMAGSQTLLQRRALGKYHTPGLWANSCCTHPLWQESTRDCAIRRLREELGLESIDPVSVGQVEYRADVGGGMTEHEEVEIFRADISADLTIRPNPAEVMEVRWVELAELASLIAAAPDSYTPWLRIYLAEHAGRIFA